MKQITITLTILFVTVFSQTTNADNVSERSDELQVLDRFVGTVETEIIHRGPGFAAPPHARGIDEVRLDRAACVLEFKRDIHGVTGGTGDLAYDHSVGAQELVDDG